jgi:hypothetical protein
LDIYSPHDPRPLSGLCAMRENVFTGDAYRVSFTILWFLYDTPAGEKYVNNKEKAPINRQGKIGATEEQLRFICGTPRQKKYEIVVRCAKVELGLSK